MRENSVRKYQKIICECSRKSIDINEHFKYNKSVAKKEGKTMANVKYIRVSTTHQNTDRQEQNLKEFDKVFIDKQSGKDTERPAFKQMMEYIREGDTVQFESFSRISRSLPDLLNILAEFDKKGVYFVSEKEQIRTDGATGRLVVAVLGAIGAYEREINAERREFGYKKALEAGTIGRPEAERTPAFTEAVRSWKAGEITATEAMKRAGMKRTTFYKLVKQEE